MTHLRFLQPLFAALLLACSLPALAAYDIGQLMNDLARNKGGRAKFVEKKFLAVLDKPLVATVEPSQTHPAWLKRMDWSAFLIAPAGRMPPVGWGHAGRPSHGHCGLAR